MSRSARLLDLLQALRRHRRPVTARVLAEELGVSPRTLYRDIATLQSQGAGIEGEAGIGYVLRPGFLLPPLNFPPEEIEALVLGARWVAERTDGALREAALGALARIQAVLPAATAEDMQETGLLIGPGAAAPPDSVDPALLRRAIRLERKLAITYQDGGGAQTARMVWPFALAFFDEVRMLLAWCELRQDFRHFRTDRIATAAMLDDRYPRRRQVLMREWRARELGSPAG